MGGGDRCRGGHRRRQDDLRIEYYIKILKQKTIQRDLISASYDILRQSFDESTNVDDLIDNAQTKVFAAIQNNVKRDVQDIGSIINSVLDNLQELQNTTGLSGVPSGFPTKKSLTISISFSFSVFFSISLISEDKDSLISLSSVSFSTL